MLAKGGKLDTKYDHRSEDLSALSERYQHQVACSSALPFGAAKRFCTKGERQSICSYAICRLSVDIDLTYPPVARAESLKAIDAAIANTEAIRRNARRQWRRSNRAEGIVTNSPFKGPMLRSRSVTPVLGAASLPLKCSPYPG
jgi:hypothetical protein